MFLIRVIVNQVQFEWGCDQQLADSKMFELEKNESLWKNKTHYLLTLPQMVV